MVMSKENGLMDGMRDAEWRLHGITYDAVLFHTCPLKDFRNAQPGGFCYALMDG
ncbi:hypothetical protein [Escherichia coli]|uniref:hypothetical protein n=1 Tax=Escherichia coli TaxID=562 RepID=UPI00155A60FC|nr:hypothetical protein [Escherichia coli]